MSESSETKQLLSHKHKAAVQFSSGAVAGFIEVCVNHPLDVVKTRLQMQSAGDPNRYKSIADCFRRMTKSEGVLSIYKGIVPVLVVETPKMALRFLVYEQTKRLLSPHLSLVPNNLISGFLAGAIEGIAVNPFEVVKVRLQTDRTLVAAQPSAYSLARQIYRKNGLGREGLSLGLTSNIFRHGVFVMFYFTIYAKLKEAAPEFKNRHQQNLYKKGGHSSVTSTSSSTMSERSGVRKLAREATIQIASGGSAGFVEICLMHPLDVVKTRFQVQHNQLLAAAGEHRYTSIADCFRRMVRSEGYLAIYKGILPPILAETPKRAVKFFTFEQYKKMFAFGGPQTAITLSLAGLFAGLTEAVFVNPFEVVKVRLQTDKQVVTMQPSTFAVARQIYREAGFGLRGLNLGLTSTMSRNGLFNMFYFGFYFTVKDKLPKLDSEAATFAMRLATGFVAGTGASMMNIPFDVAKSRIQGPQPGPPGTIKYRTCLQSVRTVYVEEGFFALYKGLLPKVLRLGPGGAVMLVVYEHMHEFLKKKFPG
ncbi:mitochondrial 2-oxodicarboxylate carrier [Dermacentor variabilis]|uniref:mitochondrial 2-oxodicarboxylate carrier n=1 Tax=Dermacentor variabilis TaxID=34621 RepID=UPI003F5BF354